MTWKYLGIFVSIDHSITRRLRWHASALATRYKEQIPNPAVDLCKIPESITISETSPRRTRIMGTTLCPTAVLFEIAWLFSNFFWRSRRCDLFEHTFCDKRTNHLSFGDPQAPTKARLTETSALPMVGSLILAGNIPVVKGFKCGS